MSPSSEPRPSHATLVATALVTAAFAFAVTAAFVVAGACAGSSVSWTDVGVYVVAVLALVLAAIAGAYAKAQVDLARESLLLTNAPRITVSVEPFSPQWMNLVVHVLYSGNSPAEATNVSIEVGATLPGGGWPVESFPSKQRDATVGAGALASFLFTLGSRRPPPAGSAVNVLCDVVYVDSLTGTKRRFVSSFVAHVGDGKDLIFRQKAGGADVPLPSAAFKAWLESHRG